MVAEHGGLQIVDALVLLVMEEIIGVIRRIPHERIRQRIVEKKLIRVSQCSRVSPAGNPVDMPVVTQRQVPMIQNVQKTVDEPQFVDKTVDAPVVVAHQPVLVDAEAFLPIL